jgi:hypothetical protein
LIPGDWLREGGRKQSEINRCSYHETSLLGVGGSRERLTDVNTTRLA